MKKLITLTIVTLAIISSATPCFAKTVRGEVDNVDCKIRISCNEEYCTLKAYSDSTIDSIYVAIKGTKESDEGSTKYTKEKNDSRNTKRESCKIENNNYDEVKGWAMFRNGDEEEQLKVYIED